MEITSAFIPMYKRSLANYHYFFLIVWYESIRILLWFLASMQVRTLTFYHHYHAIFSTSKSLHFHWFLRLKRSLANLQGARFASCSAFSYSFVVDMFFTILRFKIRTGLVLEWSSWRHAELRLTFSKSIVWLVILTLVKEWRKTKRSRESKIW